MMLGGVICGYWATGRMQAATAPARVMTMDSTEAKMGLSMKKCENMAGPPVGHLAPAGWRGAAPGGLRVNSLLRGDSGVWGGSCIVGCTCALARTFCIPLMM